jgi:hypothetical protein
MKPNSLYRSAKTTNSCYSYYRGRCLSPSHHSNNGQGAHPTSYPERTADPPPPPEIRRPVRAAGHSRPPPPPPRLSLHSPFRACCLAQHRINFSFRTYALKFSSKRWRGGEKANISIGRQTRSRHLKPSIYPFLLWQIFHKNITKLKPFAVKMA